MKVQVLLKFLSFILFMNLEIMVEKIKKSLPHLLIVIGFILVALFYFKPVLSGKVLQQSDTQQAHAMSSQSRNFNKNHKETTYWMENAFGGMPTYMNAPDYPNLFIKKIDQTIRFLPHPADILFLYFIGIYILFLTLKIDYKLAAIGALGFGFSTYLIIILGVGHTTKAIAIGYMPLVISGICLVFRKKYLWGGLLLALSAGLELSARHFQITYYLLYIVLFIGIFQFIHALKQKKLPEFFKAVGIMAFAGLLAIGANITNILATKEYTDFSTRGNTGLTINSDGTPKTHEGMSYDYITQFSYGFAETMNLFIPRFTGGASVEKLDTDSHAYKALIRIGANPSQAKQFLQNVPTYWGDQPIVAAPNYIGATLIFLFVLALYLTKGRWKWMVVSVSALALLLALGKNLGFLTHFFIDYIPFYSKFRTVAMIQVIPEFLVPLFGIYGLGKFFSKKIKSSKKLEALKWATIITGGICLFFILFKGMFFDFKGMHDAQLSQNIGTDFTEALIKDRKAMLVHDAIRSLIFILLTAGILWALVKEKVKTKWAITGIGLLILIDLIGVDHNYVGYDDFMARSQYPTSFQPNQADLKIMKDQSHYRVLDLTVNPMSSARASQFHNSIGGYHAAKPARVQDLFDFYIANNDSKVINLFNIKYFITEQNGKPIAQRNPDAFGNAWLVDSIQWVSNTNEEILNLGKINPLKIALINDEFKKEIPKAKFKVYPGDSIHLSKFQPNKLVYQYNLKEDRLAVFSEMYFPHGWEAQVDNKSLNIVRADYAFRAVLLPAGKHEITFRFSPKIIKVGGNITLATGIILGILLLGGLCYEFKKERLKNDNRKVQS